MQGGVMRAITSGVLRFRHLDCAEKAQIAMRAAIRQHQFTDAELDNVLAPGAQKVSRAAFGATVSLFRQSERYQIVPHLRISQRSEPCFPLRHRDTGNESHAHLFSRRGSCRVVTWKCLSSLFFCLIRCQAPWRVWFLPPYPPRWVKRAVCLDSAPIRYRFGPR